jgi:siderophore synthetase component
MSFRSLAPEQKWGLGRHHIKTPVNARMTNAVRTVSPESVENGTLLSACLREISRAEDGFAGRLVILEERAGVYFVSRDPRLSDEERHARSRNLSALWRENPENRVGPNEIAMPGSAMLARSPLSDRPILIELIEQFAASRGEGDLRRATRLFLERYADVCCPGLLTLMCKYGVGLEPHLQNSILVFRDGEPLRLLVRDFGGVRILLNRLKRRGIHAELAAGSAVIADDENDLRNKLYYALFQNHFGELTACLVRSLGLHEREVWQPFIRSCRSFFAAIRSDPGAADASEDERALFRPVIPMKANLSMRLKGQVAESAYTDVLNPMYEGEAR